MKKGIIIVGSVLLLGAIATRAQDSDEGSSSRLPLAPPPSGASTVQLEKNSLTTLKQWDDDSDELYRDHEASLDLFGGGTLNEHDIDRLSGRRIHHNGRLGLGAGGSVFFCRYVGIMGEAYSENPHPKLVGEASGSLVIRFPLDPTGLAPYIFAGAGHQFEPHTATFGHGGAGLEFRFLPNLSIFVDGRWVSTDSIGNYGMARAGMRFVL